MKHILLITIVIITLACSGQTKRTSDESLFSTTFIADSVFIRDFEPDTSIQIRKLINPLFGRDETAYQLLKERARYFEILKMQLDNGVIARVVSADFPGITQNQSFKILFLVTYDQYDNEIDAVRLAKYELMSDVYALETGIIKKESVQIERYYSTIDFNERTIESYSIDTNGKLIRLKI
ncbi:hypothetical protein [Carboxylicivirga sp. RSCT41]|uniref:hypothetical protein n=1 Tax=Carboxylicivirga agarovorans TaxID=3417570 RepID=UPI003D342573